MEIRIVKVKQYNSTYKHIVMVGNEPLCITKSASKANDCVAYLLKNDVEIKDGKIKKKLDEILTREVPHG